MTSHVPVIFGRRDGVVCGRRAEGESWYWTRGGGEGGALYVNMSISRCV